MTVSSIGAVGAFAPSAATTTDAASGAGSSGSAAGSSSNFATSLQQAVSDAASLPTVSLGEMMAGAPTNAQVIAVTRGTAPVSGATQANVYRSLSATSTGSLQVPAELRAYGNGHIPPDRLELIGINQHRLWGPAAEAFKAMRAAAKADGVDIGVTDSYRTYAEQVDLAQRKGLYKNGGYAAVPGTSPHGWGLALDVDVTPAGLAWLRANGPKFGYVEVVPREPWHWEYHGAT